MTDNICMLRNASLKHPCRTYAIKLLPALITGAYLYIARDERLVFESVAKVRESGPDDVGVS